ncbi:MAG: helix-turn-helix transcriptional regulator [Gammaproteobacteria bacterium]|nr:helix-turn-helix transcriptional regulator [Gammaproteobacteria bacterium]
MSKIQQYTTFSCVLGNLIKKYRNEQELSQLELAEKMGVNRITLSKIENGESEISAAMLAQLNELFDKDLMNETKEGKELLEANNVEIYYSNKDIPKDNDTKKDSNTGKFIAGAIAIATLVSFLSK